MEESRTQKSLKNSVIALMFYFIALILEFFSRKIFLDHLGVDVLGLNTTATSLLQFLNIAELGIGSAIAFALYRPLAIGDKQSIIEVVSLQGYLYKKVGILVIVGSVILMCFFPVIFEKIELPLWYTYASFGVLAFSSVLSYFYNYKQSILAADQKNYKIQYSFKLPMLVKVGFQMCAVIWLPNGYVWWLVLEGLFAVIATITLSCTIAKSYPYLCSVKVTRSLREKYHEVYIKIKQLLFGKIASFALSQVSPLIIYAYIDLALVALYGNYMIITNGISALLRAVFNDMAGGVGNLVASSEKLHILKVFRELFCVRFMISCTLTFAALIMVEPFISVWIGEEYLLDKLTLILIVATMYIQLTRHIVESFIGAYGLFSDIFAPIIEAILNIGLSIIFGYYWGLNGILLGVLVSLFLVVGCWKPYFLFSRGFQTSVVKYIKIYAQNGLVALASGFATIYLFNQIDIRSMSLVGNLIYSFGEVVLFVIILNIGLYVFRCGIEMFFLRIKQLVRKK